MVYLINSLKYEALRPPIPLLGMIKQLPMACRYDYDIEGSVGGSLTDDFCWQFSIRTVDVEFRGGHTELRLGWGYAVCVK